MKRNLQITLTWMFFALLSLTANAQIASNSPYTLEQSVIAGGGGTSADTAGNKFSVTGAIGQSIADTSRNAPYTMMSGFFTAAAPLAPTAAMVTIGGRVMTDDGRGIRNVVIVLTDSGGNLRTAKTTSFGYYSFADVAAGGTYIITARGKRFSFTQSPQVVDVNDDTNDINFVGNPTPSLRYLK